MVWRIRSLGQEVPAVDVNDSKSISAHQVDYIPPSPPRKLFASSRGYRDEYGIAEMPDSFFEDWLSTHNTTDMLDDQASTGSEPKQEASESENATEPTTEPTTEDTIEGAAIDTASTEKTSSDALCIEDASQISLSEQYLDRWTDMNQSIEQYFDDSFLDLPPSPSPSSQDLIPWASTKEIMERLKAEQERDPLSFSSEVIVAPPPRDPGIVHQNQQMFLDFPGSVEAEIYRVDLHFLKYVRERQDKWLELDLSQIGSACPEVQGLFALETPWDCEFSTPDLIDKQAASGYLEYQFSPQSLRVMTFRQREDRDCATLSSNDEPHTSVESEPEDSTENTQSGPQQISYQLLESIDETELIKPRMSSPQAARPRRNTERISRDFLHQFLVFFFFMMVAVFTATGGPPEAIATPANTLSTLRGVASDMRRQGSSIQTMVMETFRDAQLHHDWNVYRALWMSALTNKETNGTIQELGICLLADRLMPGAVGLATESMDTAVQYSTTASPFIGNVTMLGESTAAGSLIGDVATPEALATWTAEISTENHRKPAKETNDGNKNTWSSFGRRILSRVGCSTSAHCIMMAAAEDDDPQWEVFERYRCDAKKNWQVEIFKDRIDDFLGWKPCELTN